MKRKRDTRPGNYDYDACLSFAGEDRAFVRRVAHLLRGKGVRVFFDEYAQADMWGKGLYTHLDDVYQNAARYCVLFASRHYARKVWSNHERESAQARAVREHAEYILPARFDRTHIPGLRPTVGYIDLSKTNPSKLADPVVRKVGDRPTERYFPPVPDRLFARAHARSRRDRRRVEGQAYDFFRALTRMTVEEREVVFHLLLHGCPSELPDNVHINIDLLRRVTGFAPGKAIRLLSGLQSLGFFARVREEQDHDGCLGSSRFIVLEWHDLSTDMDVGGNATHAASAAVDAVGEDYCEEHALDALRRLDFAQLATATKRKDSRK